MQKLHGSYYVNLGICVSPFLSLYIQYVRILLCVYGHGEKQLYRALQAQGDNYVGGCSCFPGSRYISSILSQTAFEKSDGSGGLLCSSSLLTRILVRCMFSYEGWVITLN